MSCKKIYSSNPEACTGCMVCELVCSLKHEKTGINPKRSMIKIISVPEKGNFIPNVCQQCEDAPCISACPSDALLQESTTGIITVNEETCTGCNLCIDACVYNAIFIHPEKNTAVVCDICGGEPMCVKYCMQEAIVFLTPENYENKKSGKTFCE
jgi:carbon-monoxide dehydrogenase iron sulfur subunit